MTTAARASGFGPCARAPPRAGAGPSHVTAAATAATARAGPAGDSGDSPSRPRRAAPRAPPQPCRPKTASRSFPRGCECPPGRVGIAPRGERGGSAPCSGAAGAAALGAPRAPRRGSAPAIVPPGVCALRRRAGLLRSAVEQLRAAGPQILQALLPGCSSALAVLRGPWQGPAPRCRVWYLKSCDYANLT